jgi:threonine/homoserine/homoserine lactone efflux protein
MLTLVLAQSLRHGSAEGCKIALVPLITDLPIICLALALAAYVSEMKIVLGVLSVVGGAFVLYLAVETFLSAIVPEEDKHVPPHSWLQGILVNVLNPHPWLFWMTVGATILAKALVESWFVAAAFLGVFYLALVGSKLLLALLAGRSRTFLTGRVYRLIMQSLGVLLSVCALFLLREGLTCVFAGD